MSMIEGTLILGSNDVQALCRSLIGLHKGLKPHAFCSDEDGNYEPITDQQVLRIASVYEEAGSIFLQSNAILYHIKSCEIGVELEAYGRNDVRSDDINEIVSVLQPLQLYFGSFFCSEEFAYRNRISIDLDVGITEAWVGRNFLKNVPGLYWINIFSDDYCEKFSLNTIGLVEELGGSLSRFDNVNVIRLYENPSCWGDEANRIDDYLSKSPTFFFKGEAESAAMGAKTFFEFSAIVSAFQ